MRVLVLRRFIRLGILLAVLCLTPAFSPSALALPKPFHNYGDDYPQPPNGDGDGTVVKSASVTKGANDATMTKGIRVSYGSIIWRYLRLVRMGYGLRWYW